MNSRLMALALVAAVVMFAAGGPSALADYTFNASDFATQVVSYTAGTGAGSYNNANSALGRPTVDTKGDGFDLPPITFPVVPVYPALKTDEVVSIGYNGELILKFDHQVANDPNNPFGLDLIIFGNSFKKLQANSNWTYGDPAGTTAGTGGTPEPGIVSVSQDGVTWHTFTNRFADTFAPTLGRMYDTENPDAGLNSPPLWTNLWWGAPTDPTLPLDPAMDYSSLDSMTVAQIAQLYGQSAGGTGFDLDWLGVEGLDWIQYVRITNPSGSGVTPEIDAVSDVAPVCEPGTLLLLVGGGLAVAARRRRRI